MNGVDLVFYCGVCKVGIFKVVLLVFVGVDGDDFYFVGEIEGFEERGGVVDVGGYFVEGEEVVFVLGVFEGELG